MAKYIPGMYVRCPVVIERDDETEPRTFVLGMVRNVDEIASTVRVRFFDLYDSGFIYGWAKSKDTYPMKFVRRAASPVGFPCRIKTEKGLINGRVLMIRPGEQPEDFCSYVVDLENGKTKRIPENQIMLDYTGVDYSPLKAMSNYEFQHPSWFGARYTVSSTMHVLRNAVYGFSTLAGCRTFMMTHQVTTILRCLQSDRIRYMLADEVGMGKTIEACSVVKIQKQRSPKYRTAYIVPDQLVDQWKFELDRKFAIQAQVASLNLDVNTNDIIFPLSETVKYLPILRSTHFDMIIVDETHKILKNQDLYQIVQELSENNEHILLLSATPVTARKEEFKRLLSLLDPARYLNMSPDQFEWLVSKQHDLGDKLYELYGWVQDYDDYAEDIWLELRDLQEMLGDQGLGSIIEQGSRESAEQGKQTALRVLAYICEEYRMEKNIIRNRRGILNMAKRTKEEIFYAMSGDSDGYAEYDTQESLLDWMESVKDQLTDDRIREIIGALFSSPWALRGALDRIDLMVDRNLDAVLEKWERSAEAEIESVDTLLDDPERIRGRLLRAYDYLEQETNLTNSKKKFKGVVFTSYPETLDRFADICRRRLGEQAVAVLKTGMGHDMLEEEATRFQSDDACRLIICDPIGTEGRNLQNANLMIHLDTPWDVGQVEQRIGRMDRIGRQEDRDVLSVVICTEDSIEEQLYKMWDEGMQVYSQSLCGLEIILDTILEKMMKAMRQDLRFGLQQSMEEIRALRDELDWELQKEAFFDMASILYHPLQLTIQNMLDVYQNKEDKIFAEAMMSWASQAGFRSNQYRDDDDEVVADTVVEFSERRFSPKATTNAFLIPPKWDFYHVREGAITGTFNRNTAIEHEELLFYAPGDQVFDHIIDNAISCLKGRVSAFALDSAPFNFRGFVLIWNVEPRMYYLYKNNVDPIIMAKFRAYLPLEQVLTIWPEQEGYEDVTPEMMDELFRRRRDIRDAKYLGKRGFDSRRGYEPLEYFKLEYPKAAWQALLKEAYAGCEAKAREEVKKNWNLDTAKAEANRILYAQEAVSHFFGQDMGRDKNLKTKYDCMIKALENYQLTLDSIVYLRAEKHGTY